MFDEDDGPESASKTKLKENLDFVCFTADVGLRIASLAGCRTTGPVT